ncbi:hypothetical protein QBC34DRAFT_103595 [Podospora aff. communis PSN243]|uniref:Uncharacterized protein n=1 Tax=Podospora aff. communis PSN243 TaxID=3040156 RepID=A0AAV9H4L4_9PEZI|nr:hypothetical protein QBC34DRAFT_103595 [Podospora aff. communis PSN243]
MELNHTQDEPLSSWTIFNRRCVASTLGFSVLMVCAFLAFGLTVGILLPCGYRALSRYNAGCADNEGRHDVDLCNDITNGRELELSQKSSLQRQGRRKSKDVDLFGEKLKQKFWALVQHEDCGWEILHVLLSNKIVSILVPRDDVDLLMDRLGMEDASMGAIAPLASTTKARDAGFSRIATAIALALVCAVIPLVCVFYVRGIAAVLRTGHRALIDHFHIGGNGCWIR